LSRATANDAQTSGDRPTTVRRAAIGAAAT
jgi:hypothetical protein